jgi:two-component sensor histidine kinase
MQIISELSLPLIDQGFRFDIDEPTDEFTIKVNSEDILRIFNNVFTNIDKYADEEKPVNISIKKDSDAAFISFTNTIRQTPRKNESSKIGLISISSLMKRQGGSSKTKTSDDSFTIELKFPCS